jgi:NADH:ubiquinone reductase (H+-translocating)
MPNDLSVRSHPEIFVVGDTAHLEQDGKPLPGLAKVAMQEGRCAGTLAPRAWARRSG